MRKHAYDDDADDGEKKKEKEENKIEIRPKAVNLRWHAFKMALVAIFFKSEFQNRVRK